MVQPIQHSAGSGIMTTVDSGAKGGVLGLLAGISLGGLIGGGLGALVLGGVATILSFGTLTTPALYIGGVAGGAVGAYFGAITGGLAGIAKGTFRGADKVHAQEMAAKGLGHGKQVENAKILAEVRGQAAEQYAQMGYAQGLQDGYQKGQVDVVQQLQQAALEQQQAEAKGGFAEKFAKDGVTHAERVAAEQAQPTQRTV